MNKTKPNPAIADAQKRNAELYRRHARRAPWNSKTRREWESLAESAEACARVHTPPRISR